MVVEQFKIENMLDDVTALVETVVEQRNEAEQLLRTIAATFSVPANRKEIEEKIPNLLELADTWIQKVDAIFPK